MDDRPGIGSLLWYAEAKRLAVAKIMAFAAPADASELRIYHGLYLINLFALLDLATELLGGEVLARWSTALDGIGGLTSENNCSYLRELRNAAVHRAADITAAAVVLDGIVCPLSPAEMFDRHQRRGPFQPPSPLLRNIFAAGEDAAAFAIGPLASSAIEQSDPVDKSQVLAAFDEALERANHMPEWAKQMARIHVPTLDFDELQRGQQATLKSLLSQGAIPGLAVPYP